MEERKDISWELVRNRCVRKKEKKKSRKKNKKWVKWDMRDTCKEIYKITITIVLGHNKLSQQLRC